MGDLIGSVVGGYTLAERLGAGSAGEVYLGRDSDGNVVSVRLIHSALSLYTVVQTYWDEIQRLRELHHRHMALPTHADWSLSGRYYVVSELLRGARLDEVLRRDEAPISPAQVIRLLGHICLALEACHAINVSHGRLHPGNVYLVAGPQDPEGSAVAGLSTRVTDFSLARLSQAQTATNDSPGAEISVAADVAALGRLLEICMTRALARRDHEAGRASAAAAVRLPAALAKLVARAALPPSSGEDSACLDAAGFRAALEAWAGTQPAELSWPSSSSLVAPRPERDCIEAKESSGAGVSDGGAPSAAATVDEVKTTAHRPKNSSAHADERTDEPEVFRKNAMQDKRSATGATTGKQAPSRAVNAAASDAFADETAQAPAREVAPTPPPEEELAAIAASDSNAVKSAPRQAEAAAKESPHSEGNKKTTSQEIDAFFDEDGDVVELPLERSVRAFVANLSPSVPAPKNGKNGAHAESLDSALDLFVKEARAISAAIPAPKVEDADLAELAKVPAPGADPQITAKIHGLKAQARTRTTAAGQIEGQTTERTAEQTAGSTPPVAEQAARKATPQVLEPAATTTARLPALPPPRRSPLGFVFAGVVIGGLVAFGLMRVLVHQNVSTNTNRVEPATAPMASPTTESLDPSARAAEPKAPAQAQATEPPATGAAPAPGPSTSPLSDPQKAASGTQAPGGGNAEPNAAPAPQVATEGVAPSGQAKEPSAAASAAGGSTGATEKTAPAAEPAAKATAEPAPAPAKLVPAAPRHRKSKKAAAATEPAPKPRKAAKAPGGSKPEAKEPEPATLKKKTGGEWVDPFAQ